MKDLDKWRRANWDRLPAFKRKMCIDHLMSKIPLEVLKNWKDAQLQRPVSSTLREVMKDSELPPVTYEHDGGAMHSNWSDYYTGCLEELLEGLE